MNEIVKERWLTVPGFSRYEVSSFGNIRTKAHTILVIREGTEVTRHYPLKNLKTTRKTGGYVIVDVIADGTTKTKSQYLHRLIGFAFHGVPKESFQINHKDGVRDNNVPTNLEWITCRANHIHRYDVLGNHLDTCITMLGLYGKGVSYKELSKKYSVSVSCVFRRLNKAKEYFEKNVTLKSFLKKGFEDMKEISDFEDSNDYFEFKEAFFSGARMVYKSLNGYKSNKDNHLDSVLQVLMENSPEFQELKRAYK